MASRLRALRVVHPFPSSLNTLLVLALALIAGAAAATAAILAVGMLGIQLCIGAVNDVYDRELDARTKPWKPISAGLVSERTALLVAWLSALIAALAVLSQGVVVAALAAIMLAAGLFYDVRLKRTVWAWVCFSVAFATLPVYAWYGAAATLPPLYQFVIPLAALAGPALQLSNGLVDLERDAAGGITTLATRLGRRRTLSVIGLALVTIYTIAWITLVSDVRSVAGLSVLAATCLAVLGWVLLAQRSVKARGAGWSAQAVAIALLAWGWLAGI